MIKKFTAVLLITVFVLAALPARLTYANEQSPIPYDNNNISRTLRINTGSSSPPPIYNFSLLWPEAPVSSTPQNVGDSSEWGPPDHPAAGYEIAYRNASQSEGFQTIDDNFVGTTYPINAELDPGSLYVYRVRPFHYHDTPPAPPNQIKAPPIQIWPRAKSAEVIYMTDLRVRAENTGTNQEVTIIWDNPSYDGSDVISKYNIWFYSTSDTKDPFIPTFVIDMNDPAINISRVGSELRFTHSFAGWNDRTSYMVEIEPVFDPSGFVRVGTGAGSQLTRIYTSGNTFSNDFWFEFYLDAQALGRDIVLLSWTPFNTYPTPPLIKELNIYREPGKILVGGKLTNQGALRESERETRYVKGATYWAEAIFDDGSVSRSNVASVDLGDPAYTPYKPTVLNLTHDDAATDHPPCSVDMTFLAYAREPNTDNDISGTYLGNTFIDDSIIYRLWVTDDPANFGAGVSLKPIWEARDASDLREFLSWYTQAPFSADNPIPVFGGIEINQYRDAASANSDTPLTMADNKVYYFKLAVLNLESNGDLTEVSGTTAYGWHYVAPHDDISTIPIMLQAPPLRVIKESIGTTSMTIEWDARWIEAYDPRDNKWYASFGITEDGKLSGDPLFITEERNLLNQFREIAISGNNISDAQLNGDPLNKLKADLGGEFISGIRLRISELKGDIGYRLHYREYNSILPNAKAYIDNNLLNTDANPPWTDISGAKKQSATSQYTYSYEITGLTPNTPYVAFLRPYRIKEVFDPETADNNTVIYSSYYPVYVTATTLPVRPPLDVKPTAPTLEVLTEYTTDQEIFIRFTFNPALAYTIYYSDILADYKNGGGNTATIDWNTINGNPSALVETIRNPDTGIDEMYLHYTIGGLFPDTEYIIWVEAYDPADPNDRAQSNPVTETTKDLRAPAPPRGFSPATERNLKSVGVTDASIGQDYLILEWMRDTNELRLNQAKRAGEAVEPAGSAQRVDTDIPLAYHLAKFPGLIPNQTYYARAKTVLVVKKVPPAGPHTWEYSYMVQLAMDEGFTAIVAEITIPPLTGEMGPGVIVKESDWTSAVHLIVGSDGTGDGSINEKHYPLPNKNFEVLYDSVTRTLTYRFRSNEKDANGDNDNNVDLRFISDLIKNGNFVFDIDLSTYGGNPVDIRDVVIPYSIIRAFDERKVSLKVAANMLTVTLPPGSLNVPEVKSVRDYGVQSFVTLRITEQSNFPALHETQNYINIPQKVSLTVKTPTRTVNLTNTAVPMDLSLKANNHYGALDANRGAFVSDSNTGGWQRLESKYDSISAVYSLSSRKLSNYALIARGAPVAETAASDNAADNMELLASKIDLTDLPSYDPNGAIHPNQFNLLVLALARGQLSVSVNTPMTNEQISSLGKAGMLVPGSRVPLENGVNAIIRLYEFKTGRIKNYPSLAQSSYPGMQSVSPQFQAAMLKAEEIGLLDIYTTIDPKRHMTFTEALYMLGVVIEDAGL